VDRIDSALGYFFVRSRITKVAPSRLRLRLCLGRGGRGLSLEK
jgi:hypothetical protein